MRGVAREGGDHGPALPRDDVRRLQGRRQGLLQGGQRGATDGQAAGRQVSVHCTVENYEGPGMHSFKEALLGKIWDFMLRLRGVSTFLNMHVTYLSLKQRLLKLALQYCEKRLLENTVLTDNDLVTFS